jgi:putative membrane protein
MAATTDAMAQADRVLSTPLPLGYSILISQIVALYVYLLPFQLFSTFGWNTIPATVCAGYIILGLEAMGNELENPFGNNVNDLPLDHFCDELRKDLDVVMSTYRADGHFVDLMKNSERYNKVLWPLSNSPAMDWNKRSTDEIRQALRAKVTVGEAQRLSEDRPRTATLVTETNVYTV